MRARILLALAAALVVAACADDTTATTATTSPAPTTFVTSTTTTTEAPATTSADTTAPTTTSTTTTTTLPPPPPLDEFELDVELVADGFDQPVLVTSRPGDDRLFVVEQAGLVVALDADGSDRSVFFDINERVRWKGEQGLLGLVFYPDDGDRFVVHYTANDGSTIVEEYTVTDGAGDRDSGRLIFTDRQPNVNHNGGMIDFGPDGYLYVGLGDGGGSNDQYNRGQDPFDTLAAILRLDLSGDPYAIPPDNPFADGVDGAPEVWAWGLRNPWRFAFDGTDLWVGDVGQGAWEEIDLFSTDRPGDNAGWPLLEGTHCFRFANCDPSAFLGPVIEYAHRSGRCSVTGGAVYRGSGIPELVGTYLYGDYCTGEVWGLRLDPLDDRLFTDPDDVHLPRLRWLTSFGVGPDGELYVMQAGGQIWRFVKSG